MQSRVWFRRLAISAVAFALLFGRFVLAPISAPAGSPPKVFSASLTSLGGTHFQMTITNDSTGSAVLGSATITPTGVTINTSPAPSIFAKPSGKTWTASLNSNTIKLTAVNDVSKLSPGQFVTVDFYAAAPSSPGSYVFKVAAKPTLGFSGSSFFTELGGNPAINICDTSCGASNGDVNNPPPNIETGSFTLDGSCPGCSVSISNTPGDFCNTPNPPGKCKAPVGPQFDIDPSYFGFVHFILACDKSNCPLLVAPSPTPTTTGPTTFAGADYYPVYYTDTDAPTNSGQFVQILPDCSANDDTAPCVVSETRTGSGDLQTTLLLFFGGGGDPRPMH